MSGWELEHTGTIRAVRSKMARFKKNDNRYFTMREWAIIPQGEGVFNLKSRNLNHKGGGS
jgi:hypothetical protein